jgi:hypothetical protein
MKLLIGGKPRNIYFRKDNTVYYKSNNNENDITKYFKKSGGLKKQYSNLLVENKIKKRKTIIGGTLTFDTFSTIRVFADTNPNTEWDNKTKIEVYTKLLQMFLLAKIRMDNHSTLFETGQNLSDPAKIKFINALQIIAGIYDVDTFLIEPQKNNNYKNDDTLMHKDYLDAISDLKDAKKNILDNFNNNNKTIDNDLQVELNEKFARFNKLDNYRNNNISALFTEDEVAKYKTHPIDPKINTVDNDVKTHILDIVSYQRIATKLRIIKEINETLTDNDVVYMNYQLKALDHLKKLMIHASIFQNNDIPSEVLPSVISPVLDNQNIGTLYTNAPDIIATSSSNNVISNGANNRPVVIDNNPVPDGNLRPPDKITSAFGKVREAFINPLNLKPIKKSPLNDGPTRGRNPFRIKRT